MMLVKNIVAAYGEEGLQQIHLRMIRYDQETGLAIVRCDHRAVNLLQSVLRGSSEALKKYNIKTIGTSGSLKALRRKFLKQFNNYGSSP